MSDPNPNPTSVYCTPAEISSFRSALPGVHAQLSHSSLYSLTDDRFLSFASDICVSRYLRAHNLDVAKACRGMLETFEWRQKIDIEALRRRSFSSELTGLMHITGGRDRSGRPIILNRKNPRPVNDQELKESIDLIIYTLERASDLIDSEIATGRCVDGKWIWLLDLSAYARSNRTPFSATREVLHIVSSHYPERLYRAYIIDGPSLFGFLYSMVKPFIDARTKAKIQFLHDRKSEQFKGEMGKLIETSQLEEDFGGQQKYDEAEYWAQCPFRKPNEPKEDEKTEQKEPQSQQNKAETENKPNTANNQH
jgi:hypothetical protein